MVKQTEENIQKVSEINQLLQEFWDAHRNIVNGEPQSYAESFFRICNDKIKQLFDDVITADADEGFRLMKEGMDLLCKTLSNIEKVKNQPPDLTAGEFKWKMPRVCRHVVGPAGKYSRRRNAKARARGGNQ